LTGFRRFWAGQAVSSLGDAFAFVAIPLLVFDATRSVAAMGTVSATGVAAQVVAGLFSGAVADRMDRRKVMIACDLLRTAVYGLVPLCWALGFRSMLVVYVTIAIGGMLGNLFSVAYVAALPEIVGPDRLQQANGQMAATQSLAYVLGPLLAGLIAARLGSAAALAVDALSFLGSAASLAVLRFGRPLPGRHGSDRSPAAGLRYLWRDPLMRPMTALIVALGLTSNVGLSAGIMDLMVFHLKRDLLATSRTVGIVLALASVGAVMGAAAAPVARRRLGFGACFLGGTALQAIGLLSAGLVPSVAVTAAGGSLWAAGLLLRSVSSQALRQQVTPPEMLGRAAAAYVLLAFSSSALGTTLVTRAAARWGAAPSLGAIGASVLLVVVAGMFTPVVRRVPPEAPSIS
jgi:predicted MFS family arabinose efflux permease